MDLLEQLVATAIVTSAVYSFVGTGFGLIFAVTRLFHFAHAVLFIIAGYVGAALAPILGLVPAIVAGVVVSGLGSVLVEVVVYGPMKRRSATSFTLLAASLGIMLGGQGLIGAIFGTARVNMPNPLSGGHIQVLAAEVTYLDVALVLLAVIAIPAFLLWVQHSRQGRGMLAVAEEPSVAISVGVSERKVRVLAVMAGTLLSTPAAIYMAMRSGLAPDEGLLPVLYAFAGMVVGGIGKMEGTILGILILVFISTLSTYYVANYWMLAISLAVLLLFLVWKPTGLLGRARRATAL